MTGSGPVVTPLVRYCGPCGPWQAIWLKNEACQVTGAFKFRGNFARLSKEPKPIHAVTASTGNHGLGLAAAANVLGHRATVFVPASTPYAKCEKLAAFGAELIMLETDYDGCEHAAREHGRRIGATYVPSFDDDSIIEGHRALCREVDASDFAFDTVFAPVGGGGLVSTCVRHWHPHREVVGVELDEMPAMQRSLATGTLISVPARRGPAEGLRVRLVGAIPFSVCMAATTQIALVRLDQIHEALRALWLFHRIRAEEAGAASLAAALARGGGRSCLCIISGGNIDADRFDRLTGAITKVST